MLQAANWLPVIIFTAVNHGINLASQRPLESAFGPPPWRSPTECGQWRKKVIPKCVGQRTRETWVKHIRRFEYLTHVAAGGGIQV
jgi:hypothetical protein